MIAWYHIFAFLTCAVLLQDGWLTYTTYFVGKGTINGHRECCNIFICDKDGKKYPQVEACRC